MLARTSEFLNDVGDAYFRRVRERIRRDDIAAGGCSGGGGEGGDGGGGSSQYVFYNRLFALFAL